ncbi:SH3 domain-containing protein [Isoptericola sp. NPDC019693]|uniref:SH3 domain-containing protein n=1 Tax=Isoptericola sp. NPDC019693 TaxID=3364009 RepID=UPI0037875947
MGQCEGAAAPVGPVRVVADHEIPSRAPVRVAPGDEVRVGDRDDTWPAFVFVTTQEGSGWVPERHLDDGRPVAVVRTAYDTQELAVTAGETVEMAADDPGSGWSWCVAGDGRAGWVPHRALGRD